MTFGQWQTPNVSTDGTANYTPAFPVLSLYDPIVRFLSRDRAWRSYLLRLLSAAEGQTIVDAGCGTGTFLKTLARDRPGARLIGVDPDDKVLNLAREKLTGSDIELRRGYLRDLVDLIGPDSVTHVVCSLVLHQVPMGEKRAGLKAMFATLKPGGTILIADYGLQRTAVMRNLFRLVQAVDGKENTQPNADGILPELIVETGFDEVAELKVFFTPTGSISIYRGRKPGS